MSLFDVINDEQILNLALEHICERDEDKCDPIAERIVVFYAMQELEKEQEHEPTDEEIKQKYSEMIVEKVIDRLTNSGYVEVEFDNGLVGYEITDKGKEELKHDS